LEALGVDSAKGLDAQGVHNRHQRYGPNRLKQREGRAASIILLNQFKNLIILLLAVAAVVSFVFGQHLEMVAIVVAILLNVAIGFFTELRATRSMEALRRLGRVEVKVRRSGRIQAIASENLVPGDIVLLERGRSAHPRGFAAGGG
jgi:Ca2+-transporting ATPase